jgi:hypothetical protein
MVTPILNRLHRDRRMLEPGGLLIGQKAIGHDRRDICYRHDALQFCDARIHCLTACGDETAAVKRVNETGY